MDPQSPPKRMTRARAAAKANETSTTSVKSTKIVTAAAKAKAAAAPRTTASTPSTSSTKTATKRKLRSDDADHEDSDDDDDELATAEPARGTAKASRTIRGRPKKAAVGEDEEAEREIEAAAPAAPVRTTRGRPAKKVAPTPAKEETTPATRSTRASRAKKANAAEEPEEPEEPAPAKPATRTARAAITTTKSSTAKTGVKTGVKKTVTFEEPEKENIIPVAATKRKAAAAKKAAPAPAAVAEPPPTGLRARPARKQAVAAATATTTTTKGRATRGGAAKATAAKEDEKPPTPLSPKKVTQLAVARDVESEDELAGNSNKSPLRPLMKSPVRPPQASTKPGLSLGSPAKDNNTILNAPQLSSSGGGLLGSPIRRPTQPASPYKDAMKSPARRGVLGGNPVLGQPKDAAMMGQDGNQPSLKSASAVLFGSPAKRPKSPVKGGSGSGLEDIGRSPLKMSLLNSPAKRPMASPIKSFRPLAEQQPQPQQQQQQQDQEEDENLTARALLLTTPRAVGILADDVDADAEDEEEDELLDLCGGGSNAHIPDSPTRMRFPGRLSAVLPRHADPALKGGMLVVAEEDDAAAETAIFAENTDGFAETAGEPMDVDEFEPAAAAAVAAAQEELHKQQHQPDPAMHGNFGLRQRDLDPFAFSRSPESDSEDELSPSARGARAANFVLPETPCRARGGSRRAARPSIGIFSSKCTAKRSGAAQSDDKFGFTPLAEQLNGWRAARSPIKATVASQAQAQADPDASFMPSSSSLESSALSAVHQTQESPIKAAVIPSFFDDEMSVRSPPQATTTVIEVPAVANTADRHHQSEFPLVDFNAETATQQPDVGEAVQSVESPDLMEGIPVTTEDIELAAEANEMSLLEPSQLEEMLSAEALDDAVSEASQEYGDENEIPIDPSLAQNNSPGIPPVTPQRFVTRTFHTVSKVPLKPADESTPPVLAAQRQRRHSISRLPTATSTTASSSSSSTTGTPTRRPARGGGLTRNATVISYSPTKKDRARDQLNHHQEPDDQQQQEVVASAYDDENNPQQQQHQRATSAPPPTTPSSKHSETAASCWSTAGTPARTPKRDNIDPALLRGAVVFVDVHTSEGADASGIFVELLGQMGARCVKSWPWNPRVNSPPPEENNGNNNAATAGSAGSAPGNKIGITHVVYKDGGKRTLEKVRESGGVVQCVGVSWVLDCERENEWLDEAPYYIDTSLVPRGGARRRKSMEPKALANLNGMLVSSPTKGCQTRGCQTAPATPVATISNRRDSTLWMRTPEAEDVDHHQSNGAGAYGHGYDNQNSAGDNGDHLLLGGDAGDESEWDLASSCVGVLTPVPKTPSPETVARMAANVALHAPETPTADLTSMMMMGGGGGGGGNELMMTRTCPPKPLSGLSSEYSSAALLGEGVLAREKDEGVLMRLMAARRKSLQFAPKVGSPLARAWQ